MKYWVGWRKYYYNFTATPTARKGFRRFKFDIIGRND